MPLTKEERARVRDHLGYPNHSAASTFQFGVPAAVQTLFMIEPAMDRLLPEAEGIFRTWLAEADELVAQFRSTKENDEVTEVGEIKLNPDFQRRWGSRYDYCTGRIANMLNVPCNPFDQTRQSGVFGGSMNLRVRG